MDIVENVYCSLCHNDKIQHVSISYLQANYASRYIHFIIQFMEASRTRIPMLHCALGRAREDITVKELLVANFNIEMVVEGPKDRYELQL